MCADKEEYSYVPVYVPVFLDEEFSNHQGVPGVAIEMRGAPLSGYNRSLDGCISNTQGSGDGSQRLYHEEVPRQKSALPISNVSYYPSVQFWCLKLLLLLVVILAAMVIAAFMGHVALLPTALASFVTGFSTTASHVIIGGAALVEAVAVPTLLGWNCCGLFGRKVDRIVPVTRQQTNRLGYEDTAVECMMISAQSAGSPQPVPFDGDEVPDDEENGRSVTETYRDY